MADSIISQEVNIEMLEKLTDGTFKIKYPKTKADLVIGLTKGHVGLGNVQNYGIATKSQAEAGTVNTAYMTPLRVKEAIVSLAGAKPITGTYTGTGSKDRLIAVQGYPVLVVIISREYLAWGKTSGVISRYRSGAFGNSRGADQTIVNNGFYVSSGDDVDFNRSGTVYDYIAFL